MSSLRGWAEPAPTDTNKNRHRARYKDPDGKKRTVGYYPNKVEAEKAAMKQVLAIDAGDWTDPDTAKMTFKVYCETVWIPNNKGRWSLNTKDGYEKKLENHIYPRFGNTPIGRITAADIEGWMSDLAAAGKSQNNIASILRVLAAALSKAVRYKVIKVNPAQAVDKPRVTKPEWNVLEDAEAGKLLDTMVEWGAREKKPLAPVFHVAIMLELSMGARYSELVGITRASFDPLHNTVILKETVHEMKIEKLDAIEAEGFPHGHRRIGKRHFLAPFPKNKKPRVIPIDEEVMEVVIAYMDARGLGPADLVFTNKDGVPITNTIMRKVWKTLLDSAGVPDMRMHDMRHSVATWLTDGGMSLAKVMDIMGHSQLATAQLYQHVRRNKAYDDSVRAAITRGKFGAEAAAARAKKKAAEGK